MELTYTYFLALFTEQTMIKPVEMNSANAKITLYVYYSLYNTTSEKSKQSSLEKRLISGLRKEIYTINLEYLTIRKPKTT